MKKAKLVIFILIAMLTVIFPLTTKSAQINPGQYNAGTVTTGEMGALKTVTEDVLATIRNIGIITSVVILAIIGIKYILGSLDEKAEYKGNMVLYVIGCFVLAMATTIPSIVYQIMK